MSVHMIRLIVIIRDQHILSMLFVAIFIILMYIIRLHRTPPLPLVEGAAVLVLLLVEAHLETIGLEMIIPMIGVEMTIQMIGVEMIMKLQSIGMMVSTCSLFYVLV